MRLPMYDVRFSMYDLGNSAATPRIWRLTAPGGGENAAYVRCWMYDVRFINNVRVAQIFSDH